MTENEVTKADDTAGLTMSVPEAGRLLGIGRDCAYEAAARGQIPTLRIGRLLRVPRAAFERMLESAKQ
jgi:excisionase family DNA binding protein